MSAAEHAVAADTVFDGQVTHRHAAVVIEGSRIVGIQSSAELPSTMTVHSLPPGAWLAPGFIDLQVNGGGDVLFNDQPTADAILQIAAAHRRFGTTALLPTFISDTPDKMRGAIEAVEVVIDHEPGVLGIHLEGPFLSSRKPGVHRLIRPPTADDLDLLTARRKARMLMTLAPEEVPAGFIAQLTATGMRVALGHSMATYAQTRAAMAEGLTGFTHLFNAMRGLESREPGPIAAAIESPDAWFGMIVDGVHVDPAVLRLSLRGAGRPMLVTDAMPPVGGRQSSFMLYGEAIAVRDSRCLTKDGRLAGAALDMATAVRNCVRWLNVPIEDALRFASTNPAQFLGVGDWLGRLAPGYRADMVGFTTDNMEIVGTWVAGVAQHSAHPT